jgi:hypothetical protein
MDFFSLSLSVSWLRTYGLELIFPYVVANDDAVATVQLAVVACARNLKFIQKKINPFSFPHLSDQVAIDFAK